MIPLIDFQRRSQRGKVMKAQDFDMAFAMKVRELVTRHGIAFDRDQLIVDDKTADAVFQAGVDLLAEVGLYHLDTQRVIEYTRDEILAFAAERKADPARVTMGRGADEMTLAYRTSNEERPPTLYVGAAGAITEEEFIPLMTSFARERRIKGMGIAGGISKVGDVVPEAGTLSEIQCALWEQERLREVLESVGRPGLSLGLLCTASTAAATMACFDGEFRGPHNTHIGIHIMPEQKVNWDRFILAHFCQQRGIVPWQSAMTMIGALCRNGAEAAVALVASVLGHLSYGHGPICSVFATHIDGSWATRDCTWAASGAARASERNIGLAIGGVAVGSMEWAQSPINAMQDAAQCLIYTKSGMAYAWLAGMGPHETVRSGDIMEFACHLSRDEATDIVTKIYARIDELIPKCKRITYVPTYKEIYDLKTLEPLKEHAMFFTQAQEELAKLGVKLG
jgi:methylamine---corrinoid protein Co-methyltransferase